MHILKKGNNKQQKKLSVGHVWRKKNSSKNILFGEVEELGKKKELSYQKLAHHLDLEKKIKHKGKEVVKM